MHYSLFDLLSSSLIPELSSNISARASCNIQFGLIFVAATRALPNEFAVLIGNDLNLAIEAAFLAVVALSIKLSVHNVVVDELHNFDDRVAIVLHIVDLNITDRAAGRESLELGFKCQFFKCIDLLSNVNVVAVGDVALIGNTGNDAVALLATLRKLVGSTLKRSTIKRVMNILCSFPFAGVLIQLLHYHKSECFSLGFGEFLTCHSVYALPKSCISKRQGRVTAVEIFINGLTFFKTEKGTVLP